MPKRKYCPTYIKYGFIAIEHGGESLLQCVICMKNTLSDSAIKPSLLKGHLVTNHVKEKEQDESYFQRLGENAKKTTPRQDWRDLPEKEGCCHSIV